MLENKYCSRLLLGNIYKMTVIVGNCNKCHIYRSVFITIKKKLKIGVKVNDSINVIILELCKNLHKVKFQNILNKMTFIVGHNNKCYIYRSVGG